MANATSGVPASLRELQTTLCYGIYGYNRTSPTLPGLLGGPDVASRLLSSFGRV